MRVNHEPIPIFINCRELKEAFIINFYYINELISTKYLNIDIKYISQRNKTNSQKNTKISSKIKLSYGRLSEYFARPFPQESKNSSVRNGRSY